MLQYKMNEYDLINQEDRISIRMGIKIQTLSSIYTKIIMTAFILTRFEKDEQKNIFRC